LENRVSFLTIRNATVGILAEGNPASPSPALSLSNTQIYNSSVNNLWGRNTSIEAENAVLGNAGAHSLLLENGGSYSFLHTTIANYWSNGFRTGTALMIGSHDKANNGNDPGADLLKADFVNCIVDGNTSRELTLEKEDGSGFNFSFSHILLKFRDTAGEFSENPLYDFSDPLYYDNILLNADPGFTNPIQNVFTLEANSEATGAGDLQTALMVPLDILGRDRTQEPALGAYQQ
jgi:hypothetical protein